MNNPNHDRYMDEYTKEINVKEFLKVLKKRFWIVLLITIISTTAGYFLGDKDFTPIYQSTTRIIIGADEGLMSTLMVMIKDPIIMEKVQKDLHLSQSPEGIAGKIDVTRIEESQVLMISVKDTEPERAANIANSTAKTFKSEVGNILEFNEVQLLSDAKPNNIPINENKNRLVVIALIVGFMTGIGFIFLLDALDEKVEKEREFEKILGVPVIGVISNMKSKKITAVKKNQKKMEWRESNVGSE